MASVPLLRKTESGPVQGFVHTRPLSTETLYRFEEGEQGNEDPLHCWLGIPFGKSQRWSQIKRAEPWTEPLACYDYSPMPPQPGSFLYSLFTKQVKGHIDRNQHTQAEEGWETVNIFAPPSAKAGDGLPVLVWVHGGSNNNGSAGYSVHDPSIWLRRSIRDGKPFVFVSLNYRVNIFGFLASKDLQEADEQGLAGNYGLRDVMAVFEWVQRNISEFGGSASNVTAFGESAGAWLISQLLFASRPSLGPSKRKRLFRRAIMQSGSPATISCKPLDKAFPKWNDMLKELCIEGATARERIEALRLVPWSELLAYGTKVFTLGIWALTVEQGPHAIWTDSTVNTLAAGDFDDQVEAVIVGINQHEGAIFVPSFQTLDGYAGLLERFPPPAREVVEKFYPGPESDNSQAGDVKHSSAAQLFGDGYFFAPALQAAAAFSTKIPTYVYCLRTVASNVRDGLRLGVVHTGDIHFIFNLSQYWGNSEEAPEAKVAKLMGDAWIEFATNGKPGSFWQPYESSQPQWLSIEDAGASRMEDSSSYKPDAIRFWKGLHTAIAQGQASREV